MKDSISFSGEEVAISVLAHAIVRGMNETYKDTEGCVEEFIEDLNDKVCGMRDQVENPGCYDHVPEELISLNGAIEDFKNELRIEAAAATCSLDSEAHPPLTWIHDEPANEADNNQSGAFLVHYDYPVEHDGKLPNGDNPWMFVPFPEPDAKGCPEDDQCPEWECGTTCCKEDKEAEEHSDFFLPDSFLDDLVDRMFPKSST